jgi:hypothetical protein
MPNKSFTVDNQASVVGGRNIESWSHSHAIPISYVASIEDKESLASVRAEPEGQLQGYA